MKSNPNLYDDYDDLKGWNTLFQPSIQEAQLYSKEFKHIDFSDRYFLDIGFGSGGYLAGHASKVPSFLELKFRKNSLKKLEKQVLKYIKS